VTCETVAGNATKMAAASTMPTAKAAAASTMATASTSCERGGGGDRQNAGQNQTGQ
jgi:hypothetical protein